MESFLVDSVVVCLSVFVLLGVCVLWSLLSVSVILTIVVTLQLVSVLSRSSGAALCRSCYRFLFQSVRSDETVS